MRRVLARPATSICSRSLRVFSAWSTTGVLQLERGCLDALAVVPQHHVPRVTRFEQFSSFRIAAQSRWRNSTGNLSDWDS